MIRGLFFPQVRTKNDAPNDPPTLILRVGRRGAVDGRVRDAASRFLASGDDRAAAAAGDNSRSLSRSECWAGSRRRAAAGLCPTAAGTGPQPAVCWWAVEEIEGW